MSRARGQGDPNPDKVREFEEQISQCLDYYDAVLSKRDGLGGSEFSLVDVFHIPFMEMLSARLGYEHEIASRSSLKKWWARVTQRPSWKAIQAKVANYG